MVRLLAEAQAQVNIQTEVQHYTYTVISCLIIVGMWYILHGLTITHKPQLTVCLGC